MNRFGIADIEKKGDFTFIKSFVEKPKLEDAPSRFAKIVETLAFHCNADESPCLLRHEINFFRTAHLRGKGQVAFVFTVFVVDDYDEMTIAKFFNDLLDIFEGVQNPDLSNLSIKDPAAAPLSLLRSPTTGSLHNKRSL